MAVVTGTYSLDAIIQKTYTSPSSVYSLPVVVGSNSTIANDATSITLTKPTDVQEGDILIAMVSMDLEGTAGGWFRPGDWTEIAGAVVGLSGVTSYDSRQNWYRKVATATEPATYTWNTSGKQSDQVGIIIAVRDGVWSAGSWLGATLQDGDVTSHSMRSAGSANDVPRIVIHAITGNDPDPHVWTPSSGQTVIADVVSVNADTAAGINMLATYHIDAATVTTDSHSATSSLGTSSIAGTVRLDAVAVPYLGLYAEVISRRTFGVDALIAALETTTHARTGPHVGTHPDTAIVTSALLGSLPVGTDLNTVIRDLDALITSLERKEN